MPEQNRNVAYMTTTDSIEDAKLISEQAAAKIDPDTALSDIIENTQFSEQAAFKTAGCEGGTGIGTVTLADADFIPTPIDVAEAGAAILAKLDGVLSELRAKRPPIRFGEDGPRTIQIDDEEVVRLTNLKASSPAGVAAVVATLLAADRPTTTQHIPIDDRTGDHETFAAFLQNTDFLQHKDAVYHLLLADGELAITGKWLACNAILWRPLLKRGLPIAARHVLHKEMFTIASARRISQAIRDDIVAQFPQESATALQDEVVAGIAELYNLVGKLAAVE